MAIFIEEIKEYNVMLPRKIERVMVCSNKKCASLKETYVNQSFILVDEDSMEYKCEYCDSIQILKAL